jgi:hypothetical protein
VVERGREAMGDAWVRFGRLKWIIAAVVLVIVLAYPIGMLIAHQINDDVDFVTPAEFETVDGSHAVAMAAALIHREVAETKWVANTPFPFPASLLDNMPNFQTGLIYAVSRFAIQMTDSLGRTRGTSQVDPDLDKASGLLKYDGTVWIWEPSISIWPTARAESQYLAGMRSLLRYNQRLAAGEAVFDRRADNLIVFLDSVAADLGSASAAAEDRIHASSAGWFDTKADDVFYASKGRLYGYYMLLRELGRDFDAVLAERNVGAIWQQMLQTMRVAAGLDPWIISNAAVDGLFFPNHLAAQGFYLLRARAQLREVGSVLAN